MSNDLTIRPPLREWIPYASSIDPFHYRVLQVQSDSSILGQRFFVMRVELTEKPKRWQHQQLIFDIIVLDTHNAQRCQGKTVKLRRIGTLDSGVYIIHDIVSR